MALNQLGRPARRKSVYGHQTSAGTESVYTCPPNCASELTFIHVHNSSGNVDIEIEWYIDEDNYTSHFIEGKNLGAGEYLQWADIELIMQPGDEIRVTTTGGHVDSILTVTETFAQTRS